MANKSTKKVMEEAKEKGFTEIELLDKGIANLADVPFLTQMRNVTSLILSHNRLTGIPPSIADLQSLENLNLFNNEIEELPTTICNLTKLKFLNLGLNNLSVLPKGFGACPMLEVLDLTYNSLSENSLPGNFFYLEPLRALYLGDNEFEKIAPEVKNLKNLQVLVLRDNDIINLPNEIGDLSRLRELHIQNNRIQVLPPSIGHLSLAGPKNAFRAENNPWIPEISDQLVLGVSHVLDYLKTKDYASKFQRYVDSDKPPPPKKEREKTLKKKKDDKKK